MCCNAHVYTFPPVSELEPCVWSPLFIPCNKHFFVSYSTSSYRNIEKNFKWGQNSYLFRIENCSGKISVLLKWKVFIASLELEMGKLGRHETGFIKVEVLPSQGPRGSSRKLVIKSGATVLVQLLCALHWMLFLEQRCFLYSVPTL